MTTYRMNESRNGIEITFTEKPQAEIIASLKNGGYRWHKQGGYWYNKQSDEAIALAKQIADGQTEAKHGAEAPNKAPARKHKPDKQTLEHEYAQVWHTSKMIDYCVNKVAAVAVLPNGQILPIDKEKIKTRFCFDDSYDYDGAQGMARHASTSCDYLKAQNMESFDTWVHDLAHNGNEHYMLTIRSNEKNNIVSAHWDRITDILDACGGSAYLADLPGQELVIRGSRKRIATNEEIEIILSAYTEARAEHEKKVDRYIKRYGTSKVHSWTYWGQA